MDLTTEQLAKAMRLNAKNVLTLRKDIPKGWPKEVGSAEFAKKTLAFQEEQKLDTDGIYGKQTDAAYERLQITVPVEHPGILFSFDDRGWLRQPADAEIKVQILHLQSRKNGTRKPLPSGKHPVSFVVNHHTAFERPIFDRSKLAPLMKAGDFAQEQIDRINKELGNSVTFPGGLYQCLQNEAEEHFDEKTQTMKPRQASWDFLVESKGSVVTVVQYNLDLEHRYSWHAGPNKKYFAGKKEVKNRDGEVVWKDGAFVGPYLHINARSFGIENSFYGGPFKRKGDRVVYPFNGKDVDVTDRMNGSLVEKEGFLLEQASELHMTVLANLNAALIARFALPGPQSIIGHYHVDPITRTLDPVHTTPVAKLRELASLCL